MNSIISLSADDKEVLRTVNDTISGRQRVLGALREQYLIEESKLLREIEQEKRLKSALITQFAQKYLKDVEPGDWKWTSESFTK